jgi:hypothetical protein
MFLAQNNTEIESIMNPVILISHKDFMAVHYYPPLLIYPESKNHSCHGYLHYKGCKKFILGFVLHKVEFTGALGLASPLLVFYFTWNII